MNTSNDPTGGINRHLKMFHSGGCLEKQWDPFYWIGKPTLHKGIYIILLHKLKKNNT